MGRHAQEGALALAGLLRLGEEDLRLLEEFLGAHVRFDRVEDDPDALGQLVQEIEVSLAERLHRCQLDHRLNPALKNHRQDDDAGRWGFAKAGLHGDITGGHRIELDPPPIPGTLPDEAFAPAEGLVRGVIRRQRVACRQAQHRLLAVTALDDVEGAVVCRYQRRDLGQDQVGDRAQVALALQHASVLGDVRLEPVLLHVLLGRLFQVADHLVDLPAQ